MFPADALPAIYIEEREMEMRAAAARKAEMERAAKTVGQSTSSCNTPMASPAAPYGFFSTFWSAIRGPSTTTPAISRAPSSSGVATPDTATSETTTPPQNADGKSK